MKYEIKRHDGTVLTGLSEKQAEEYAEIAGLVSITVDGVAYYENPKSVANIKPIDGKEW